MGKGILEIPPATVIITANSTWSAALISRESALWIFPVKAAASSPLKGAGSVTVTPNVRSTASAVRIMRISVKKPKITRNQLLKRNLPQNHQLQMKLEVDWTMVI